MHGGCLSRVGIEIQSQPSGAAADDDRRVLEWRRDQLLAAAFPDELAGELARDWRYDLHALIELTERGCAPTLAARILAPLEEEAASIPAAMRQPEVRP